MSTDTPEDPSDDGDTMTKIDVRVPQALLDTIDEEYAERGFSSRSEAVRDALRTWANPPTRLSEETLDDLATSREQAEGGETHSAEDVRDRLGLDDDSAE
jgi:Arc/MetJ-type ribon-helix-helix transcriptional regulator